MVCCSYAVDNIILKCRKDSLEKNVLLGSGLAILDDRPILI